MNNKSSIRFQMLIYFQRSIEYERVVWISGGKIVDVRLDQKLHFVASLFHGGTVLKRAIGFANAYPNIHEDSKNTCLDGLSICSHNKNFQLSSPIKTFVILFLRALQ